MDGLTMRLRLLTHVAPLFLVAAFVAAPVAAQQAPSPWVAADIGAPTPAGSTTYSAGTFTINAGGSDIWGTSDQFHFVYQPVSGDVEVLARVDSLTNVHSWSKAGVMIRSSLAANAAHGVTFVSAAKGTAFQRRTTSGGSSTNTTGPAVAAPRWVRTIRVGTRVTSFTSVDGKAWTLLSRDTIALGATAYVGIAATSHNNSARTRAVVSQVAVRRLTVPAGQTAIDIGAPTIPGTAAYAASTYTVLSAGLDIWNTADQFNFIYQPITGDVDVKVRVRSISNAHGWSKTGVMVRESLTAGSRHAFALLAASGGYGFHRRIDPGGFTTSGTGVASTAPGWVRLVRTGANFEAFRSSDGVTWVSLGTDVVPMADSVYVGIATTSHNTSATTEAVLENLTVGTGAPPPPPNQPPTVSLTSPADGASYVAPASVSIAASAADADGTIARVEFYSGASLLATDTTAPYSFSWASVPAGTYSLTALAYDNTGAQTRSAARSITVTTAPSSPPTSIVFQASVDHATVTSYRLEIFASGANPSTATPVATSDLGKPAPDAAGDISVNRATFFSALAPGNYQATVSSMGSSGSARSAPLTFSR